MRNQCNALFPLTCLVPFFLLFHPREGFVNREQKSRNYLGKLPYQIGFNVSHVRLGGGAFHPNVRPSTTCLPNPSLVVSPIPS
jgi:hypothetical protein